MFGSVKHNSDNLFQDVKIADISIKCQPARNHTTVFGEQTLELLQRNCTSSLYRIVKILERRLDIPAVATENICRFLLTVERKKPLLNMTCFRIHSLCERISSSNLAKANIHVMILDLMSAIAANWTAFSFCNFESRCVKILQSPKTQTRREINKHIFRNKRDRTYHVVFFSTMLFSPLSLSCKSAQGTPSPARLSSPRKPSLIIPGLAGQA